MKNESREREKFLDGLRVLIVDSVADVRALLAVSFRQCGAEVTTAESVAEALNVLENWQPHVLVTDIVLPDEDGYALIGKIRGRAPEQGGKIPAVALTACAGDWIRQRAFSSGFDVCVSKPFEPYELAGLVAGLISGGNQQSLARGRNGA